jgi:capsular polysaccharide biosynthesis protein
MMILKKDLVSQLGTEKALIAFRQIFGWPHSGDLCRLPILGERDFAAERGTAFHETAEAGIAFVNDPPPVLGEGCSRPLHGVTRSQYVACLRDARTRGRSGIVLAREYLLLDAQRGELERVDEELSWDPAILHADTDSVIYVPAPNEDDPIRLPVAFNLLGAHSDFFGHWMCEYLPKLGHAVLSGLLPRVPLLIDAHMPASHRRSIELLFPEQGPIIEVPAFASVLVDHLWVAPDVSYYPLYDAGTGRFTWDAIAVAGSRIGPVMADLRARAVTNCTAKPPTASRVFLARKPARHRRLVNYQQIYAEAQSQSFVIVYPEDLTFEEQIALMQGARHIIITEGSAAFLGQFASAGTQICILSHPMNEPMSDFNVMFRELDIALSGIVGPIEQFREDSPHDSSYRIDLDSFKAHLDTWLGSS